MWWFTMAMAAQESVNGGAVAVDQVLGLELGRTTAHQVTETLGDPDDVHRPDLADGEVVYYYDGGKLPGVGKADQQRLVLAPDGHNLVVVDVQWDLRDGVRVRDLTAVLGAPTRPQDHVRTWCNVPGHPGTIVAATLADGQVTTVSATSARHLEPGVAALVCRDGA